MQRGPVVLSAAWLNFWRIEIGVVVLSVLYWVLGSNSYLQGLFGSHAVTEDIERETFLLWQGAITVFCCYVWFYSRVLFDMENFHLTTFIMFQSGMALGDALVLILAWQFIPILEGGSLFMFVLMCALAGFFLLMRVIFLYEYRYSK